MTFDYKQRITTKITDNPIGKLLNSLKMESAFFTHSILSSPWAITMPSMHNCMMFHLVLEGEVTFSTSDAFFTQKAGDFVLFPKCFQHSLSDGTCQTFTPLDQLPIETITERYETLSFGGTGEATQLICGTLVFEHPLAIKLLGLLPHSIQINKDDIAESHMVKTISDLLSNESQNIDLGAEAVIARCADLLVITAMRQHLSKLRDDKLSWIAAMEDDRIGKALKLLHDQPQKHWSLEALALAVGMSRTGFANQFKQLVGNTPMEYLTQWRMSLAYSKLQLSKESVLSIALDIGYQSESAFSRAFKKVIGKSPAEVRKAYQSTHA